MGALFVGVNFTKCLCGENIPSIYLEARGIQGTPGKN